MEESIIVASHSGAKVFLGVFLSILFLCLVGFLAFVGIKYYQSRTTNFPLFLFIGILFIFLATGLGVFAAWAFSFKKEVLVTQTEVRQNLRTFFKLKQLRKPISDFESIEVYSHMPETSNYKPSSFFYHVSLIGKNPQDSVLLLQLPYGDKVLFEGDQNTFPMEARAKNLAKLLREKLNLPLYSRYTDGTRREL